LRGVLDVGVGPHLAHERVLVDERACPSNKRHQRVEGLRRERDRHAVAKKAFFVRLQPEGAELVQGAHLRRLILIPCGWMRPDEPRRATGGYTCAHIWQEVVCLVSDVR
jgi:hypothetical protein